MYEPVSAFSYQLLSGSSINLYVDEFILRKKNNRKKNEKCEFIPPFKKYYLCLIEEHGYIYIRI